MIITPNTFIGPTNPILRLLFTLCCQKLENQLFLVCSIFLPVLDKAIPCIGKDLGMSTIAYASLMVEL